MRPLLVAFFAGLALPFAFAPFGLFPLAIISPAILFWLWRQMSARHAFLSGYLFGVGYFGLGASWVAVSMYRFGGMGVALSLLSTVLFVLVLAAFPALVGWLYRRYFSTFSSSLCLLLVLPALWGLLEWTRGWIFTGFPWLALGYSQTDSPLAGVAPLLGVYGIGWLLALSAGLLVLAWQLPGRRWLPLVSLLGIWLLGTGLSQVEWSAPAGEPLRASLIQGNVPQNLKWLPEQRQPTIDLYTRLSRQHWADSDIVIWPETALPAYYHQAERFLQGLAAEAARHGSNLMLGLPVRPASAPDTYYNSVVAVTNPPQIYNKHHLVPFGEYIPLKWLLGSLLDILQVPMADFSRGAAVQPPLEVAGQKIAVSICYEDAFGEEVIRALPAATLLVNVSNDAWFGDSLAPHQHLQMARMRSLETARPMFRATNNGISALIDHRGRVTARSPQFEVFVLSGSLQPRSGATPYVLGGNYPLLALLLSSLLLAVFLRRFKND
ncbi:MAG TPA: apolipoprotein N-acyltransferase [Gammaproteobacteria bacterium]|nr:apolipoprotein N-acyltransferase [Gammaproteobacteria bacterium]